MKTSKDWLGAYIIYINIYHLDISSLDKYHPKNGWRGSLVSEWRKLKETLQHWPPEIGKLGKIIPLNTCIIYINIYHLHDISWKHITKKMAEEKSPGLLSHPFLVSHHLTTSPWRPLLRAHPALAAGRLWVRRITAPGGGAFCGRGCLRNPTLDHGNHGNHKPQNTSRYGDMDIRYIYIDIIYPSC